MMEYNHWAEEILKDRNLALIGFADLSEIDTKIRYGYQYGICIAIALKVFPSVTNEPSKEYYDEYKAVSARLREASDFLADKIKECGFNAYSLAHEKQNEAYRTQLPFKTLATRAGLGWIGKSAALITKEYGNAIRLNGVLTDMPIKVGTPVNESLCGECDECVKHCPGHAIKGVTWSLYMDRDILLDAVSCKKQSLIEGKYLTQPTEPVVFAFRFVHGQRDIEWSLNDTHAIRFYQQFGFTLREVHINALEKSRKLKPSIPLIGMDNIPLRHEFEFEIIL